jgi:serine/threonine-protein kinase
MSPEQARGLPVDKRTDVWAFGCLLYEMLCGTRAFAGDNSSDVIARILEREPDFSALPPGLPAAIPKLLRRCLEKDRRRRLRDIGDARIELLDTLDHTTAEPTATGPLVAWATSHHARPVLPVLAVAAVLAILAGAGVWLALRRDSGAPAAQVARFSIPEPSLAGAGVAISADGSHVAYVTGNGLVIRSLDRLEGTVVVPSNNIQSSPFFSPDGQWLGFKGWDALQKVPAAGGPMTTLVDRIFPVGAWSGEDIIFGETRGLFRVPAAGGDPVRLLATQELEQIVSVEVLPGRQAVLFTVIPTRGNVPGMAASMPSARIEALDLKTGKSHIVLRGGGRPRHTRTGHLLYASNGTLYAVGFDMEHLQTQGNAVPVIETTGLIDFDVSAQGTLIYQVAQPVRDMQLVWVDRQGRERSLGAPARTYIYPRIAPDGTRIAIDVNENGAERNVWIWDLRRETLELFTKDPAHNPMVTWSPDGRQLVFGSERSGVSNLYRQAADGSGEPERLFKSDSVQIPISYTPDGRLLVSVGVSGQQRDIYLATLEGEREIRPLIHSPANELTAEVSPDGRWLTYDSDESGQFEVYVRAFPDVYGGSRWQISSGGGRQPMWSRNGRELFFRDFSGAVIAVPVVTGPVFAPGRPAKLIDGATYSGAGGRGGGRTYDVTVDGLHFLMLKGSEAARAPELVVVLNWFDELQRLSPID